MLVVANDENDCRKKSNDNDGHRFQLCHVWDKLLRFLTVKKLCCDVNLTVYFVENKNKWSQNLNGQLESGQDLQ